MARTKSKNLSALQRLAPAGYLFVLAFCLAGCGRPPSEPPAPASPSAPSNAPDQFLSLMNAGKNYLDQSDPANAIAAYQRAAAIFPNDADLRLNLAISYLAAGAAQEAIRETEEVLKLEPHSAAAYFIQGSAHLRLSNPEEAVKALENARGIEPGETAAAFQLGMARMGLKQWNEAIAAFQEGIALEPNRLHSSAHYLLAQSLLRAGRQDEAKNQLLQHEANLEGGGASLGPAAFERSKHTQPRVPFRLDQPEPNPIPIRFVDATTSAFGNAGASENFSAPLAIVNAGQKGPFHLFASETKPGRGFRLLRNANAAFHPDPVLHPAPANSTYSKMLVGDLQNDRFDDIVALGPQGCRLFQFQTNGLLIDVSNSSGLASLAAVNGILIDLDFTGKLDLAAIASPSPSNNLLLLRQFGPLHFNPLTNASGIPASLHNARAVVMEDWNRDGHMDLIVSQAEGPPLLLEKQRGGRFAPHQPAHWVAGAVIAAADFDNDLRPDLAILAGQQITLCFNNGARKEFAVPNATQLRHLTAIDHDNDGWLDLWAFGDTIRAWRNLGLSGFQEQTAQLGLDRFNGGPAAEIHFADFDSDCDSDAVVALAGGGLRYLRNDGGNANSQVKVHLVGNRSNAGGIGCKIEIRAGGLRLVRTVHDLPVEIGVGKRQQLDSFLVHWFNWPQGSAEVPFQCHEPLLALELTIQEGSCPYLYAWDGARFRFVTDFLGAAPLGLPVAEGRFVESDPEEFVWIGNEKNFPPRDGHYQLQITEELREVLYLDEAKLVVVDHEPGAEVHPTDKLRPGKPFPPGTLLTLHDEQPLLRAETLDGNDATAALAAVDGHRLSPPRLRAPQLRGLAPPHGVILDFGALNAAQPLVLVMNGWLKFGGGMANIAASHDPALPFPFPVLEAEIAPGAWQPVDVTVGAPAGKTKTILVDLEGKLPPGTRRLRLTQAFEIHWDRIALMRKKTAPKTQITFVPAASADLHFRGFSALENLPPDWPLTPNYDIVSPNSFWTVIPGGWCTRYGGVSELIETRDEGLALINSGDELTLKFSVSSLPEKPPGAARQFFLYVDGWDKDSDFHVARGAEVEPLPFHAMDDQLYGRQTRPIFPSDALHRKYNTRWVESKALQKTAAR